MATLKIGSIGAGGRGRICKLAHQPENDVELKAVCDVNPEVLKTYQEEFKDVYATSDWKQLLEQDLDAVFVTTPDFLHEEQAVAALSRGISVYLEKPMAITIEGCDRILETAQENNAKVYVGHNMRFFPVIQKMRQWIEEGRIGEVQAIWCRHFVDYGGDAYFKDWHSEQQYSTGLLLQKGAHDIDVIHYLAGAHTVRTVGMGKLSVYNQVTNRRDPSTPGNARFDKGNWPPLAQKNLSPIINVEDHSMVLMQLANGVQASYCQCHYTPDGWRNYTIIGTEGRIENMGDHSSEWRWATVHLWDNRTGPGASQGTYSEAIAPIEGTHGGSDPQIINAFIDYVRSGKSAGATAIDARWSVAAGYQATMSIRNNSQPMDVPDLPVAVAN